jgi:hypothetical protein
MTTSSVFDMLNHLEEGEAFLGCLDTLDVREKKNITNATHNHHVHNIPYNSLKTVGCYSTTLCWAALLL